MSESCYRVKVSIGDMVRRVGVAKKRHRLFPPVAGLTIRGLHSSIHYVMYPVSGPGTVLVGGRSYRYLGLHYDEERGHLGARPGR